MRFSDYLRYAATALLRIKLRSLLTIAGVAIGIGAMVLLVSLGAQAERAVMKELTGQASLKTITVFNPQLVRLAQSRRGKADKAEALKLPPLDEQALERLRKLDGVQDVFPNVTLQGDCKLADVEERVIVTNISPGVDAASIRPKLAAGGFYSGPDAREVIVTSYLADSLTAGKGSIVGQKLGLVYYAMKKAAAGRPEGFSVEKKTEQFTVVGVVGPEQYVDSGASAMYYSLPHNAFVLTEKQALRLHEQLLSPELLDPSGKTRGQQYFLVSVVVHDPAPEAVRRVRDEIKRMDFPTRHLYDAIEMLKVVFLLVKLLLGALGSIALAVAGLQIINTMSMSILERTREIGVMKAVGARNRDIRRLFVLESMLIGLIGALLGLAGAWVCGRIMESALFHLVIKKMVETPEKMTLFYIPTWLFLGALLFGVGVSLLAALWPAHRGARIDPVLALRRE